MQNDSVTIAWRLLQFLCSWRTGRHPNRPARALRSIFKTQLRGEHMKGVLLSILMMQTAFAQNPPVAQAPGQPAAAGQTAPTPTPLPTPAITGPLKAAPPNTFDAAPFGKVAGNGILTGMGMWQGNHVVGDEHTMANLSNGQVFIHKDGT